ncbi:MAG: hypothetical protein LBE21_10110 [Pseudomonadales bacterium]|jgi:hypothetical protein|nr:hypothetical protein [Pseudomonadales bacterium]
MTHEKQHDIKGHHYDASWQAVYGAVAIATLLRADFAERLGLAGASLPAELDDNAADGLFCALLSCLHEATWHLEYLQEGEQ